jgi:CRISPR-associated endonuclease Cas1
LGYELLSWKVRRALIGARLEPYLGYLHSEQFGKPSLVCDFQELFRYLVDDFVIRYCQKLTKRDFVFKTEKSSNKKGKREYLADVKTDRFTSELNNYFLTTVEVPRMKVGRRQEVESLISEEAQLFAKYLRNERRDWIPRTPTV